MTTALWYSDEAGRKHYTDARGRVACPRCGRRIALGPGENRCRCGMSIRIAAEPAHTGMVLPSPMPGEIPYRSGMHAVEALLQARLLGESARSISGAQLEMMRVGLVPRSYTPAQSIPARLDPIGDLAAAFGVLHAEDRLILEQAVQVPDWRDQARRCRRCGLVYPPANRRCSACRSLRAIDEVKCLRCGETRSQYVWDPCPGTYKGDPCGSREWRWVGGKADEIARILTESRRACWRASHGRDPLGSEGRHRGVCPRCGTWTRDRRATCSECGERIRWGVVVEAQQVGGLLRGAIYRWERILVGRGLMRGRLPGTKTR